LPLSPEPARVSLVVVVARTHWHALARSAQLRTQQQDLAFAPQPPRVLLELAVDGLAALLLLDIVVVGAHADAHGAWRPVRLAAAGDWGRRARDNGRALGSARGRSVVFWCRRRRETVSGPDGRVTVRALFELS
jgi:hypothetical protein